MDFPTRPVDPLLSAVLTCDIDPSSLRDVQRWLGFIVVALPILTNQVTCGRLCSFNVGPRAFRHLIFTPDFVFIDTTLYLNNSTRKRYLFISESGRGYSSSIAGTRNSDRSIRIDSFSLQVKQVKSDQ